MNFDFNIINEMMIPTIVIFSLVIGFILKKWMPMDNKYIPTILVLLGAVAGGFVGGWTFENIVAGMLSGLASTGLHQLFAQYLKINTLGKEELNAMGPGEIVKEEEGQNNE